MVTAEETRRADILCVDRLIAAVRELLKGQRVYAEVLAQHLVSNEMVEIDGDTATVRAMFYNPMHFAGDNAGYFDCGGWYNHELVRTDDGWKSRKLWEDFSWTTMGK